MSTNALNAPRNATDTSAAATRDLQRARLVETRRKILDTEAELKKLDTERQELEAVLETFVFPTLTIPSELISKIFLECLPPNGRVRPSKTAAPLLLAQICRQWREIALSTPGLWRSVDFTFKTGVSVGGNDWIRSTGSYSLATGWVNTDSPYDGACKLTQAWFRRSRSCSLFITLRCEPKRRAFPPNILPVLAEFSRYWGRLEFIIPFQDLQVLGRISGSFPYLHSLAIRSTHGGGVSNDILRIAAPQNAPRLRAIRVLAELEILVQTLGSSSLTTLELDRSVSLAEWNTIFQRFPNLQHLTASIANRPLNPSRVPVPRTQPPLESLIMQTGDPLPALTLPGLRHLQYHIGPRQVPTLLSFISRSACVLQHLSLLAFGLDHKSLMQCLRAVPSLAKLEVHGPKNPAELYHELHSAALLPQLGELTVAEDGCYYDYEPVLAMLRARRDAAPLLHAFNLRLDVSDDDPVDEIPAPDGTVAVELRRLIDEGLRFHVRSPKFRWPVPVGSKDTDENTFV
ncbi:hypothetical protein C8R43DRAFT_312225 [Mycena crocata]|nr:hypothetical protein C8R43DRAFT_312225 [Mycena crocata]